MSVSGARKAKELTEKYTEMMYGRIEKTSARSASHIRFCPRCGSYVPPLSICRKCGFESEEYQATKEAHPPKT